jgi:hypothetical protein
MLKMERQEFGLTFRAQTYQNGRQKDSGQWSVAGGQLKTIPHLLTTDHRPLTTNYYAALDDDNIPKDR